MGYTVEQSRRLLKLTQEANPGPYYYLTSMKINLDGSPPKDAARMLANLVYDRNTPACSNLIALYKVFRKNTPTGRHGLWVTAGDPANVHSPILMLDTGWLSRAVSGK